MSTSTPNTTTEIAQFAGAMFDAALGNTVLQSVLDAVNTGGLDPFLNSVYNSHFGNMATATVAQTLSENLGLTGQGLTAVESYITTQLDAASPGTQGATVASLLDAFSTLTDNTLVGPNVQAWNALMADAVAYGENPSATASVSLQSLPSLLTPYNLTTGTDHVVAAYNDAVINGLGQGIGTANSGVPATLTVGDTLSGGTSTGTTLNLTDTETGGSWNPTAVPQASVTGIPNVNLYSGEAIVFAPVNSLMGYTGLADVHITSASGALHVDDVVVGPSTAVTISDQAGGGLGPAPYGAYGMIVEGGSSVTINEVNGSGYGNAQHTILVSGGAGTTQVSITQTESASNGFQQGVTIDDNNGTIRSIAVSGLDNVSWTAVVNYGTAFGYGGYGYGGYAVRQFNGGDLKINNATALTQLTIGNMLDGAYATIASATALTELTVENVTGNAFVNLYNGLAKPMALALTLQGIDGTVNLFDEMSVYTTLNVSVAGNAALDYTVSSSMATDNLQSLNVSGTGTLDFSQPLQTPSNLTRVQVQGTAGFTGNLSGAGNGNTIVDASQSTGAVTVWLDGVQQQVFMGGTGPTVVYLDGNASQPVTAAAGSTSEVVLNFALNGTPLSAQTEAQITGFGTLGVTSAVGASPQAIDVGAFSGDAIQTLDVQGGTASGTLTFYDVTPGTTLQVDAGDPQALVVQTADSQGPADNLSLTLGQSGATGNATTVAVTFEDGLLQGIGTVSLNLPGTAGSTQTLDQFTDLALASLTVTGTQSLAIVALNDHASVLAVSDQASGSVAIPTLNDPNLATLTLSGNLQLTLANDSVSTGVTVNGAQDNGAVTLNLSTGAAAGATDQITLGNGNNSVSDASTSGQVSITVGSGSNLIVLQGSSLQGSIVLATHAAPTVDQVSLGAVGYTGNQAQVMVTGFNPATDQIHFLADAQASTTVALLSQATATAYASGQGLDITLLSTWVEAALATGGLGLSSHGVASFQFANNTYLVEQAGATGSAFGTGDTLVGLAGLLTITHL